MPIYTYACNKCEHEWEEEFPTIQAHMDSSQKTRKCPECNSDDVYHAIGKDIVIQTDGLLDVDQKASREMERRARLKASKEHETNTKKYY